MLDVTHKYPAPASDAQRTNAPATGPRFLEFFCGGGLARVGLGPFWNCVLANDISDEKIAAYVRNFGSTGVVAGDIAGLHAARMPGADLAWASFPCQDLSLAGGRRGMAPGTRSGAFWSFHSLLSHLRDKRRAPRVSWGRRKRCVRLSVFPCPRMRLTSSSVGWRRRAPVCLRRSLKPRSLRGGR